MSKITGALSRSGLLNTDAHEYGELASGKNNDLRGTWCMSQHCAATNDYGIQIIHVGPHYLTKCKNCGGTHLYFDRVSPLKAPKLIEKARSFFETEAKRRARKK